MFQKFAIILGKVPTGYYVLLYLLLIIGFSMIYFCLPQKSFFHSTVKYESEYLEQDAHLISQEIEKQAKTFFQQKYGEVGKFNCWEIDLNTLHMINVKFGDYPNHFSFTIGWTAKCYKDSVGPIVTGQRSEIKIKMIGDYLLLDSIDYKEMELSEDILRVENYPALPSAAMILPILPNDSSSNNNNYLLGFTIDLWEMIIDFGEGYRGFPRNLSGHYFRMLYLSAGVSTSTLTGDIVPLTNIARAILSIQGILSLIMITLFFNALGFDISENISVSKVPENPNSKVQPSLIEEKKSSLTKKDGPGKESNDEKTIIKDAEDKEDLDLPNSRKKAD